MFSMLLSDGSRRHPCGEDAENIRDPLTEVGVTPTCLRRLQLLSGGWARLCPPSKMSTVHRGLPDPHFSDEKVDADKAVAAAGVLCRAIAITATSDWSEVDERGESSRLSDDEVLIPPSVMFNAGLGPFSTHVVLIRADAAGSRVLQNMARHETVLHSPPPVACSASVSRVRRPRPSGGYKGGSSAGSTSKQARAHALALMAFFSTPRVLRVGDVFGVSVPCPLGGGGGSGGTGCWWQELQEDNGEDSDVEEGKEEEVDSSTGAQVRARTGSTGKDPGLRTHKAERSAFSNVGRDKGEIETGTDRTGDHKSDRMCSTAERRFREAIVRQGAELVFFRVTGLEGECGGGESRPSTAGSGARHADEGLVGGKRDGDDWCGATEEMVVSRCATELREGAPVCSAMPNAALYQRFVCRVQGYPDAAPKPPVVSAE